MVYYEKSKSILQGTYGSLVRTLPLLYWEKIINVIINKNNDLSIEGGFVQGNRRFPVKLTSNALEYL
jgi:hypothetical protein